MSRVPDADTVNNLRAGLRALQQLEAEITEAERFAKKLETLKESRRCMYKDVISLLDSMDVASRGNMGWEGRMTWMLMELLRQETSNY